MKFILMFMLLVTITSVASANEVSCQSAQYRVQLTFAGPNYNAVVLQKDSIGQWAVIYAGPVTQSTTRGSNLLYLGEGFGLGIVGERANSSRLYRGTLRLWQDDAAIEEQVDCRI